MRLAEHPWGMLLYSLPDTFEIAVVICMEYQNRQPAGMYPNGFWTNGGGNHSFFLRPQEAERKEVCSPVFCPYGCGSYCQNGSGAPRGGGVRFWFWDSLFRGGVHRPGGTEAAGKREAGRWAAGRRRPAAGRPGLWRLRRQSQRPFLRIRTGPVFAASHA